jgi:hypothetical protein
MQSFLWEHEVFTTGSTLVCGNHGIGVVCIVSLNWRQLKWPAALKKFLFTIKLLETMNGDILYAMASGRNKFIQGI